MDYEKILDNLSKSKFRGSFHLNSKMKKYVEEKGFNTIKQHGYEFIYKRLKPSIIKNDGKQTPMKGHPIFIAQHACACCCRKCLEKWHKIPNNRELEEIEVEYIINLLMQWIKKEMKY